jgi:hypothetical protein
MLYKGKVATGYYSARCGGQTAPAWNPRAAPWCASVPCRCVEAPLKTERATGRQVNVSHGVGLCQYGAFVMAQDGADWKEIINHYYSGVIIGPLPGAIK